jgi:hypothetical protein
MKNKQQFTLISTTPSPPPLLQQQQAPNSPSHVLTRSAAHRANHQSPSSSTIHQTRSNSRISLTSSQHINNGKIVKPIALRASSSSSSISSLSTNLSSNQTAKNALIASTFLENIQQYQQHQQCTCQIKPCKCTNFSLIAKYFASFPANRLKQQNTSKTSLFAIPQSVKNKDAELCKHFNHIVKLSDTPPPLLSSIPSQLVGLTSTQPVILSDLNLQNDLKVQTNDVETRVYDQITMETRSTRKFLIKYHPYLQNKLQNSDYSLTQTSGKVIGTTKNKKLTMELRKLRKRPSINLIKMKKFDLNHVLDTSRGVITTPNNNNETDDEIVKFIETPIEQQQQQQNEIEIEENNKKIICNCNATIQQYTQKCASKHQEDISSICGSKSSNADADSGYYSDVKLNESISSQCSSLIQQSVLPRHNYNTRYYAAINTPVTFCKLNYCLSASSNCTCDLDLNQIEND